MPRNLDLTALRAFVTVAETGGVTRAAGQLNLTQSAVSMQLKRLEESLDQTLLDRRGRGIALTTRGEQLLSYGRRMLALNDEVWGLMRDDAFEGELRFGVPHDIVYPHIPSVLQRMAVEHPCVRVELVSSNTLELKTQFAKGELDVILTTEDGVDREGEVMLSRPLIWVGAPGGAAWRQRPLRLAFESSCIFRPMAQRALDTAGIAWDMVVDSNSTRTIDATVSADLAIHAAIIFHESPQLEQIDHAGALPELPKVNINMYATPAGEEELACILAGFVRDAYRPTAVSAVA